MEKYNKKRHKYYRFNIPGHAHFLTFSCYQNQPLLENQMAKEFLADAINESAVKHNFDLWAYVFMPEHVHLLIYPCVEDYSISEILKSIKQSVSRKMINCLKVHDQVFLKRLETGLKNPRYRFWQDGGGYDRNCRTLEEIINQVNYIHDNPVRRGLVEKAEDWIWSSARDWFNHENGPLLIKKKSIAVNFVAPTNAKSKLNFTQ